MRTPSVREGLAVIKKYFSEPIDSVIDVGVLSGTDFLMGEFPKAHHYLFEPVVIYHDMIRKAYGSVGIPNTLIGGAVSDTVGTMFQHLLSSDFSGKVTHSQLLPTADAQRFGGQLLEIQETPVVTLDAWAADQNLGKNYIVKIDVDGIEEKVIAGGQKVLSNAAIVVIEAHLLSLTSRARALENLGLKLFDIVGNAYYFDQLQQVDLVFLSSRIINENIDFQPWKKTGRVIWEEWKQFT
jgi:FkbM family methyltransferase